MTNVAIFVSGTGTNCVNLIEHFRPSEKVKISLVLSNKADAPALAKARALGVPAEVLSRCDFESEVLPLMRSRGIDFIILAGFLLKVPDCLIEAYPRRIINIHPALLPKFGGVGMYGHHVHEAVKAAGERETGMTVHYVNGVMDGGEIIAQFSCPLDPSDTPDDIAAKEHVLEMAHFPSVAEAVIEETFYSHAVQGDDRGTHRGME